MSPAELLDALYRAGATLEVVDGKARLRGNKISDELRAELKANREAVLAERERRKTKVHPWGEVPPPDAPMVGMALRLKESEQKVMRAHVFNQPRPVHAWVMARAHQYFHEGEDVDSCEWRAYVDVVAWQRQTSGREAVSFLCALPTSEELGIQQQ